MIVIDDAITAYDSRNPRIGWHTVLTATNIGASSTDASFPAANMVNPLTYQPWKSDDGVSEQQISVSLDASELVNYVGIAVHNFGSTGTTFHVESSANGSDWTERTDEIAPTDDRVIMVEFPDVTAQYFRLVLTPGEEYEPPQIAILHIGAMLRLPHRIYVGHVPAVFARETTLSTGFSEDGQFLGRVVRRQIFGTEVELQNLDAAWYRDSFEPFVEAATETPFFFAWRGDQFTNEGALLWLMADPKPKNQRANGMMQVSLQVQGIR